MIFRVHRVLFFALLLTIACSDVSAQQLARIELRPFEPGAELVYEAEFSRALLRKMDIADFRFSARRTPLAPDSKAENSQSCRQDAPNSLILTGEISSKGFFSKLFNLRFLQRVESTVDPVSFTVQNTKKLDQQGKRVRSSEASFDTVHGKVVWTERDPNDAARPPRIVSSDFSGPVWDLLSAIYYLRSQPLEVGKGQELLVSDSGRVYRVPVRVAEKKRLKTVLGRVAATRVDVELFGPERLIRGDGQFSIWFTDDARRVPVSARVKMEYGTVDIKLKKIVQVQARKEYVTKQE